MEADHKPDFEAEGLLGELEGEARAARLRLLGKLFQAGVGLDALREAVAADRLVLLPAEDALSGEPRYTAHELCEEAGVPPDYYEAVRRACGLAHLDPDDRAYDDDDLAAARIVAEFYEAGLDREGMLEVGRVLGRGLAQTADAMGELFAATFIEAGVTEEEVGLRNAQVAREMLPRTAPLMEYLLKRHIRERLRNQAVSHAMLEAGELPGTREIAVSFADLVGFTRLGERLPVEDVGGVAGRLGELAANCAVPPVRLVKTIGDAAMLVSPEAEPLLQATLDLMTAAEESESLPKLRAGAAYGQALPRSGDWYGRPVNIASRITDLAEPGTVLGTRELCDAAGEVCDWEPVGSRALKGVEGDVELLRAARA